MKKRILSLTLAFLLSIGCMVSSAFASDPYGPQNSGFYIGMTIYPFDKPASGDGWSYDGNYTMTLGGIQSTFGKNEYGVTSDQLQICNPSKDFTLVVKGNDNKIGYLNIIYGGGGSLRDSQRKAVTIKGAGTLQCSSVSLDKVTIQDTTVNAGSSFHCWGLTMSSGMLQTSSFSLGMTEHSLKGLWNVTGSCIEVNDVDKTHTYSGVLRVDGMEEDLVRSVMNQFKGKAGQALEIEMNENIAYGGYYAFAKQSGSDEYAPYAVYGAPPHTHTWGDWTITKQATCGDAGMRTRTCTECGEKQSETIPATGEHTPDGNTDPSKSTYCKICGILLKAAEGAIAFDDVRSTDYFFDAVQWAVEKDITNGLSDTAFGPDASCTRAQIVTFLWRSAGSPAPKGGSNPFTDVKSTDYYYDAVLWAVENGITSGTSDTLFGAEDACSRAQSMTFLYRAAGTPAVSGDSAFTDVVSSDYYADAVQWALEEGITSGTSDQTFGPNDNCTRAQIVTFLYRAQ